MTTGQPKWDTALKTAAALFAFSLACLLPMTAAGQKKVVPADISIWMMDKKSYPKSYVTWGSGGFRKINELMQSAANLIVQSKDCAAIEMIGLSDERSDPKSKKVVFFADCQTKVGQSTYARYYVDEEDIRSRTVPVSDKAGANAASDSSMMEACSASAKGKNQFPELFKRLPGEPGVERSPVALGNARATVYFEAMGKVPQKAVCYFKAGKLVETTVSPR